MKSNSNDSAVWFLAGAAVGAAIALLFAPQSGARTRRLIAGKAYEGREALLEQSRDLYERSKEFTDEAAAMFERGKKLVQS